MLFDFAARPPEINSALMYSGAGAGPMMAAAAAWNNVAAELSTTAASYESVISELSDGQWIGPASASMAAAAAPYAAWMKSTAAAAEHAAGQATASAGAYQTAFAMTVPPPVIAANRAQLAALVATNVLGQNTPAIAATEAQYGEMWAQDAAAMYGYAGSSASAAKLTPLTSPTPTTNAAGAGAQTAAVSAASTQSPLSVLTSLYDALFGSSTSTAATYSNGILSGPDGFFNDLVSSGGNVGYLNDAFDISGSFNGFDSLAFGSLLSGGGQSAAAVGTASVMPQGLAAGLRAALASAAAPAGTGAMAGLGGAPVLAGMGQSSSVAGMSVPASWSAAAPESGAEVLPAAEWTADVDQGGGMTNFATGMPAVANAGRGGYGFGGPRYGVKPKVMPTRVLV